jgi:hypothetical protein
MIRCPAEQKCQCDPESTEDGTVEEENEAALYQCGFSDGIFGHRLEDLEV